MHQEQKQVLRCAQQDNIFGVALKTALLHFAVYCSSLSRALPAGKRLPESKAHQEGLQA